MTSRDHAGLYSAAFLGAATLGIGWVGYQVVAPFLAAIAWAIVLAVASRGPWGFLRRKLPRWPNATAAALTLTIGLLVVLPAGLLIGVVTRQLLEVTNGITARLAAAHVSSFGDLVALPAVAHFLDGLKDRAGIGPEDFQRLVHGTMNRISALAPMLSAKLALGVLDTLMTFLTTMFLLFFFIRDGSRMGKALLGLVPVGPEARRSLGLSLGGMLRAIFRGSLLCALAQGVVGGLGWWIAGLPVPVLAGAGMAVFSLLPVGGTAIVWLPGGIWLWTSGHPGAAIFLFGWGAVVTSFLADEVLRPMLIRGAGELSTLVVLLGVFGGLAAFGLLGIFIGPMVLALAVTLVGVLRTLAQGEDPGPLPLDRAPGTAAAAGAERAADHV